MYKLANRFRNLCQICFLILLINNKKNGTLPRKKRKLRQVLESRNLVVISNKKLHPSNTYIVLLMMRVAVVVLVNLKTLCHPCNIQLIL